MLTFGVTLRPTDWHHPSVEEIQERSPDFRNVQHGWTLSQGWTDRFCCCLIMDLGCYTAPKHRGMLSVWRFWTDLVRIRRDCANSSICNIGHRSEEKSPQRPHVPRGDPGSLWVSKISNASKCCLGWSVLPPSDTFFFRASNGFTFLLLSRGTKFLMFLYKELWAILSSWFSVLSPTYWCP